MSEIKIKDKDNKGILTFDLIDILKILSESCIDLQWIIKEIEGRTKNINIFELERKIENSDNGYIISWEELIGLAEDLVQTINLTLVGREMRSENSLDSNSIVGVEDKIIITALDSTYWIVRTGITEIINLIYQKFDNIEIS